MSLVDIAQRVVVATNRWPGLRALYNQAYDRGLSFSANRLGAVPGVLAVLLRCRGDAPSWVPGFSDYDLTLVTARHRGPDALRFLDDVWRQYRSIKTRVPQLGEMEVMDVEEYADFLTFGPMPTASLKRALPLFVRKDSPAIARVLRHEPRPPKEREILLDALARYGRFALSAYIENRRHPNVVTRRRAEHMIDNVAMRLAHIGVPVGAGATTVDDRLVVVFRALTEACRLTRLDESREPSTASITTIPLTPDDVRPIRLMAEEALRRADVDNCQVVVWNSYLSPKISLNVEFVVPDDVGETALRKLFANVETLDRERKASTFVASDSMSRRWRQLSPFDELAIAANGRVIIGGTNAVPAAPSLSALRRDAAVQYAVLLALKNNWRLSKGPASGQSYASLVNHANGYASAFGGALMTTPMSFEFPTTLEGYTSAQEALERLRGLLDPATDWRPAEPSARQQSDRARTAC